MSADRLRAILHGEIERREKPPVVKRPHRSTSLPRTDMKAYYREYRRMRRANGMEPMNYR